VRPYLLQMCDLTSDITRAQPLLPQSHSPLLIQVCFRGNADINR